MIKIISFKWIDIYISAWWIHMNTLIYMYIYGCFWITESSNYVVMELVLFLLNGKHYTEYCDCLPVLILAQWLSKISFFSFVSNVCVFISEVVMKLLKLTIQMWLFQTLQESRGIWCCVLGWASGGGWDWRVLLASCVLPPFCFILLLNGEILPPGCKTSRRITAH